MKATEVKKFKKNLQEEMGYTKWKKEIKHNLVEEYKLMDFKYYPYYMRDCINSNNNYFTVCTVVW